MNNETNEVTVAEGQHHPLGMSRWPAWLACPCFFAKPAGKDTEMGTTVHALLEGFLTALNTQGFLPDKPAEALPFHAYGAWRAAKAIEKLLKKAGVDASGLLIEHRCTLPDGIFGTCDAAFFCEQLKTVFVIDFKTFFNGGRDYMPQLQGYGLALSCDAPFDVEKVDCTVLYGDSETVEHQVFSLAECMGVAERAVAIGRGEGGEPTQCNWCDLCEHAVMCPAMQQVVAKGEPMLADFIGRWGDLTTEQKARGMAVVETLEKWCKAYREHAKEDLMAGRAIEDRENGIFYKLQYRNGTKKPRFADAMALFRDRGVSQEAVKAELSISATSIKNLLKGVGVKGKEAEALVDSVSDQTTGTSVMVRG